MIVVLVLAAFGGGLVWKFSQKDEAKASEQKPADEEEGSKVSHDESGHAVVKMSDETQGNLGLIVAKPAAAELRPELRLYGKVQDPTGLASVMIELASAQAAFVASSNAFAREELLLDQGNSSPSKVQTAQAAALRDQYAVQAAKDKLALSWGRGVADQTNLPAFIQPLTAQNAVLIRLDLPVGQTLAARPSHARITSLSGKSAEAEYLGTTATVDPQTLGRGAMFVIKPNVLGLMLGEAVIGYLELPGEPVTGVLVPSQAVVITEGKRWAYVMDSGGDTFTRTEIPQDHPVPNGWLVSQGLSTNQYLVVTGAQALLSEEQKASLKSD